MGQVGLFGRIPDEGYRDDFVASLPIPTIPDRLIKALEPGRSVRLWEAKNKVQPDWRRGAQAIGSCFHEDTLIFGRRTKKIKDVRVGETIFSGTGQLTKVVSAQKKLSYQPFIEIYPWGGFPLIVTADHKILVYRMVRVAGKRVTKGYYQRSYERQQESKLNSRWNCNRANAVIECYEDRKAVWVEAGDLIDTDYLLSPLSYEVRGMPSSPNRLLESEDGKFVVGHFIGDGHAQVCVGTIEWFCGHKDEAKTIHKILKECGWENAVISKCEYKGVWIVRVNSVELRDWFRRWFYDQDRVKVFPIWAIGDRSILSGLQTADGFVDSRNVNRIDSTSPSVAYGVFASLLQLGYEPIIYHQDRSKEVGLKGNTWKPLLRVCWRENKQPHRIWKDDKFLCRPIRKIKRREGPHVVYDVGVQDKSHSLIANGYIAHNCVAWGAELACTCLLWNMAAKEEIDFPGEVATESIYGGCRVEVHGKPIMPLNEDGAAGSWAADWVHKWGVLIRRDYSQETGNREHDLSRYDGEKERRWGYYGCGGQSDINKLDEIAKQYPVQDVTLIRTWEQAKTALAAGCPITIASNAGFDGPRNSDGIIRRNTSWPHQMVLLGNGFTQGGNEYGDIFNSWNGSHTGPYPGVDDPRVQECAFRATAEDIERYILSAMDAFGLSPIKGFTQSLYDFETGLLV
jgi:hypothetical protein